MKKSFGDRLKERRGTRSQEEMASVFGVSQSAYSSWERGVKEPSISTICSMCRHLGVSSDWLLGVTDAPSVPVLATKVKQAGESDTYWRDLAVSQQETIAKLAALLSEGRAIVAAPVRGGGRGVTKTA
jgi:transcriptional regulator with XRE-family HTH domain